MGLDNAPRLRDRHGAVARDGRGRRRAAGDPRQFRSGDRPGAADLRLRGGDHRRPRQSLGHARGRHHARRRAERSARRSIPAGRCSPATSCSWWCWRCGRRACSRGAGDDATSASRRRRAPGSSSPARRARVRRGRSRAAPFWAARRPLRLLIEIYLLPRAGQPVESAGRICRPGLGRPAGLCRARRLRAVRARGSGGLAPLSRHAARRRRRGDLSRCRSRRCCSACAGAISPSAPGWWPRCSGSSPSQIVAARRRLRHEPAASVIARSLGRTPHDARFVDLLDRAGARWSRVLGADRSAAALALRPRADRDPRQRARGAQQRRRRRSRIKLAVYVVAAFGTAMVGALIFLQKLRISPDAAFTSTTGPRSSSSSSSSAASAASKGRSSARSSSSCCARRWPISAPLSARSWARSRSSCRALGAGGLWGLIADRFGWQSSPLQRRLILTEPA